LAVKVINSGQDGLERLISPRGGIGVSSPTGKEKKNLSFGEVIKRRRKSSVRALLSGIGIEVVDEGVSQSRGRLVVTINDTTVPQRVQIGLTAKEGDLDIISTLITGISNVQRLVNISNKVNQEGQRGRLNVVGTPVVVVRSGGLQHICQYEQIRSITIQEV